jgi:hypothetical protein
VQTPHYVFVHDDQLVWKLEQDGVYSVTNAYKQCVITTGNQERQGVAGQWNHIWRAKVPPKVKNLLWRIGRNILSTREKLNSRGVQCPVHCVVCDGGEEDIMHVLFMSTRSVHCWQRVGMWTHINAGLVASNNAAENQFLILQRLEKDQQELLCVMVWSIWKRMIDPILYPRQKQININHKTDNKYRSLVYYNIHNKLPDHFQTN